MGEQSGGGIINDLHFNWSTLPPTCSRCGAVATVFSNPSVGTVYRCQNNTSAPDGGGPCLFKA